MTFYGNDRDKLAVPFVRPEDDSLFKTLSTSSMLSEKPRLNATAAEFVSGEAKQPDEGPADAEEQVASHAPEDDAESQGPISPSTMETSQPSKWGASNPSESGGGERTSTSALHELGPVRQGYSVQPGRRPPRFRCHLGVVASERLRSRRGSRAAGE